MTTRSGTILDDILADKSKEIARHKQARSHEALQQIAQNQAPAKSLLAALSQGRGPHVIAECKQRSPSKGQLVDSYDPVKQALAYQAGGAKAISVLTDQPYFGGSLDHLTAVKKATELCVVRKDFILEPYQIVQARAAGADSFLLLAGVLEHDQLQALIDEGRAWGMEPLVEVHSQAELTCALKTDARLIGVNNRNLKTFEVDLEHAKSFVQAIHSAERIPVCESGIGHPDDVKEMHKAGFSAFLIGEALMRAPDPTSWLKQLSASPSSDSRDS